VKLLEWGRRERIEIERKKEREKDRVSEREYFDKLCVRSYSQIVTENRGQITSKNHPA
jgi:hypothetical protein